MCRSTSPCCAAARWMPARISEPRKPRGSAPAPTASWRAPTRGGTSPLVEYQRIGPDNTFGVGVSVPLRVFDRNQGEIARTRAEVDRADALREAAAVQVLADVDAALSQVVNQRDKVLLLRDTYLPKAQRARDTVEFAYRRGGLSLLDFLDAQRTYRETSLEHLRTLGAHGGFELVERAPVGAERAEVLEAAVGGPWENP